MHPHQAAITVALLGTLLGCGEAEAPAPRPAAPAPPAAAAPAEPPRPDLFVPPPLLPRGLIGNEPGVTRATCSSTRSSPTPSTSWTTRAGSSTPGRRPTRPGGDLELLANGNLLRAARDPEQLGFRTGGTGGILQELDWDGQRGLGVAALGRGARCTTTT